jgi:hypothetical protein
MDRPQRRFIFKLALALGMTVGRLLDEIDSAELTEWMAFYQIEPFGPERGDLNAAIVAQTVANRSRGKGERPYKLNHFLPRFGEKQEQRQSVDNMKATVARIKSAWGSKHGN